MAKPKVSPHADRTLRSSKIWKGTIYGPGAEATLPEDFPDGPWFADFTGATAAPRGPATPPEPPLRVAKAAAPQEPPPVPPVEE